MTCAPPHHTTRSSSWHPVSADHRDLAESASPEGQLRILQASFAPALAGGRETMSRTPCLWASCARGSVAMVMPAAELPATIAPAQSAARGQGPTRSFAATETAFGLPDLELDDGGRLCRDRRLRRPAPQAMMSTPPPPASQPGKDHCDGCLAIGFAAKESSDVDDPHDHSVADAIAGSDYRRMSKGVVRHATARLPRDAWRSHAPTAAPPRRKQQPAV